MSESQPRKKFDPEYPELVRGTKEAKQAVDDLVVTYPKVVRRNVDPSIPGQSVGCVSFNFFKDLRKDQQGNVIYGFMKLRGNYESETVARAQAGKLVRDIDSVNDIKIAPVGVWVPITDSKLAVKEMYDIKTGDESKDEQKLLQDEARKEKDSQIDAKRKELIESSKKLKDGGDPHDDPESLNYYTMKRVTEYQLVEELKALQNKVHNMRKLVAKTHGLIINLDEKHPEYDDIWIDNYNAKRKESGIGDFVPTENQFEMLKNTSLDKIMEEFPDIDIDIPKPYIDPLAQKDE